MSDAAFPRYNTRSRLNHRNVERPRANAEWTSRLVGQLTAGAVDVGHRNSQIQGIRNDGLRSGAVEHNIVVSDATVRLARQLGERSGNGIYAERQQGVTVAGSDVGECAGRIHGDSLQAPAIDGGREGAARDPGESSRARVDVEC